MLYGLKVTVRPSIKTPALPLPVIVVAASITVARAVFSSLVLFITMLPSSATKQLEIIRVKGHSVVLSASTFISLLPDAISSSLFAESRASASTVYSPASSPVNSITPPTPRLFL